MGPMGMDPAMMQGMEMEQQPPNLLEMLSGPNANQILQVLLEALGANQAQGAQGGPMMSAMSGQRGGY